MAVKLEAVTVKMPNAALKNRNLRHSLLTLVS